MSFLAPLFLLGALAVALPVVFHLIRRTTRVQKVFSSLMFLAPSPPRLTRRSRLEHILLLLLRCTVLCLLAFAFARPFLKRLMPNTPATGPAKRMIVLLDTSASMRRGNLWSEAQDEVESLVRQTGPADQVAVLAFDRQVRPLITFEEWNASPMGDRAALANSRLSELSPGWSRTQTDEAVIRAAEMLSETDEGLTAGPRQVVLITDLQEGSRLSGLQAYDWPDGIEVITKQLPLKSPGNAGLQLLSEARDAAPGEDPAVRVRVSNAADSRKEQFEVGWARGNANEFAGQPINVYVPAGQSRVVSVPVIDEGGEKHRIMLRGDQEGFDNDVFVIPPGKAEITVRYFGSEAEEDTKQPLYFLERAFPTTSRREIHVEVHQPGASPLASKTGDATLFVVTDVLDDSLAGELRELVTRGGLLLFAPTTAGAAPSLARLLGVESLQMEEVKPASYGMLGEIDFRHPLFAPFADSRFSDFTKIHFWEYRKLDASSIPEARVLAWFDNDDPAIVEIPVGKGRVIVFTSCWHPADSQLALSSKFVPLLYSMLEMTGGTIAPPAQHHVGDPIRLPPDLAGNEPVKVRAPDGTTALLDGGDPRVLPTAMPGIYSLVATGGPALFAVNLDPAESRTAPLLRDELERLGAPTSHQLPDPTREARRRVRLQNAELEARQKMWRWIILATLALVLVETWLAGWTARRAAPQPEAAI